MRRCGRAGTQLLSHVLVEKGKNARVIDRCLEGGQIVFLIAGFRSPHHSYLKDTTEGHTLRSAVLLPATFTYFRMVQLSGTQKENKQEQI